MNARNTHPTTKRTKLGMALEQSAKEILSHVKGDLKLSTRRIVLPDEDGRTRPLGPIWRSSPKTARPS